MLIILTVTEKEQIRTEERKKQTREHIPPSTPESKQQRHNELKEKDVEKKKSHDGK
jgi:hypothetical protein